MIYNRETEEEKEFYFWICYQKQTEEISKYKEQTDNKTKDLGIRKRIWVKGKEVFDEGFVMDYIETKSQASTWFLKF